MTTTWLNGFVPYMLRWLQKITDPVFGQARLPPLTPNTFVVWEPCSHSHAEVLPGFCKYLLDLGFEVVVLATPARFDEGLFARFAHPRLALIRLPQAAIRHQLRQHGLGVARGLMITTARKISGKDDYVAEHALLSKRHSGQKLLLVEHDVRAATDNGQLTPDIITLRPAHYRDAHTTVVNPHYFGEFAATPRNQDLTRFITIGAMRPKRRNTQLLISATGMLHDQGIRNFRISVIGRGSLRGVPAHLRQYFDIKGRVDFTTLYREIDAADFFLPLLDPDNAAQERYITTGTSGTFQLIYGFAKPCLIARKFAAVNHFDASNSIVYDANADLGPAMIAAAGMSTAQYASQQESLKAVAAMLYRESLSNLRQLIQN